MTTALAWRVRRTAAALAAGAGLALLEVFLRRADRRAARGLRLAGRLAETLGMGAAITGGALELAQVFESGPPTSDIARRLVLRARASQLRAIATGHLARNAPLPALSDLPLPRGSEGGGRRRARSHRGGGRPAPLRIALDVAESECPRLVAAWSGVAGAEARPLLDGEAGRLDRWRGFDLVEIDRPLAARAEVARDHVDAGRSVILPFPPAASATEARALETLALDRGVRAIVRWRPRASSVLARARGVLAMGALGEVQCIRIGVLLGNGWVPESASDLIRGTGFDPLALAIDLVGPVRCLSGRVAEVRHGALAPTVLTWKHAFPNRLGVLDVTHAPDLEFPPGVPPREIRIEIAGTDGVLLVERFEGWTSEGPSLALLRGVDRLDLSTGLAQGAAAAEGSESMRVAALVRHGEPDIAGWALAHAFLACVERVSAPL